MKHRIIAVILLALLTFSMLVLSSCSAFSEEMYSDIFGAENGMARAPKRTAEKNRYATDVAEEAIIIEKDEKATDCIESEDVATEAEVIFYDENRYIETLDYMSDYEIIEYVMPAMELAEECDGSMLTFGLDCYDTAYYLLFDEKTLSTTPLDAVELTETYVPENTYGMDVYNIDGEYLGDRRLIGDGGLRTAYRAWNVSDFEELEEYLSNYFSEYYLVDVMRLADNNLLYFDGSLYIVRGSRGYGYMNLSYSGAQVISRRGDSCKIKVPDYTDRGDKAYNYSYIYEFVIENNRLVLDSITESQEPAGTQYN